MRLSHVLAAIAAAVVVPSAVACSSGSATSDTDAGDCPSGCCRNGPGGCCPTTTILAAQTACDIRHGTVAFHANGSTSYTGSACTDACQTSFCDISDLVDPCAVANTNAGGQVEVQCAPDCTGRRTHDVAGTDQVGFAARAYLEAVSVFAFERLERELGAHGAPSGLLRETRRARRDEIRHTAMQRRLARRRGAEVRWPAAPPIEAPARSLFEVACENAVEGCVRETVGALQGLIEARTAGDPAVRRAMRSIAADECRHAELAWSVHAWARPRITCDERARVDAAMRAAIDELRTAGAIAPAVLDRIEASVWSRA